MKFKPCTCCMQDLILITLNCICVSNKSSYIARSTCSLVPAYTIQFRENTFSLDRIACWHSTCWAQVSLGIIGDGTGKVA